MPELAPRDAHKQPLLSADMACRLAAIDIGSNSVRLIVAEPHRDGSYRILDEEREPTRLGRTLNSTGRLSDEAVEQTLTALGNFRKIAEGFQVTELRTIATCAVREARNGREFCRRAKSEVGLDIDVISSQQEAHLAFFSVQRAFDLAGKNTLIADIGGGSTEIVLASGNVIEAIFPTNLGAVRLTEKFSEPDGSTITAENFALMNDWIDRSLKKILRKPIFNPHLLIGSGGTFTTLGEIIMAGKKQDKVPVHGYLVTRAQVSHLLDRLRKTPVKARRSITGLSPDRADIIIAGVAVIDRLMFNFHVNILQIHHRGVRDGLLLTMMDRSLGKPSEDPHDRDAAIERFAQACSGDVPHDKQVARIAGRIFEQIQPLYQLDPNDRIYLEAAARLQDVGYLINYDQHHKHSYHLILNSRLAGFQSHELELIANVARYHRGAEPKKRHANFGSLSRSDRQKVRALSAILRVAGGLDRSHTQAIQDVLLTKNDGQEIVLQAVAATNPEVDLWGAKRRAAYFEDVFQAPLKIEWQGEVHASTNGVAVPT